MRPLAVAGLALSHAQAMRWAARFPCLEVVRLQRGFVGRFHDNQLRTYAGPDILCSIDNIRAREFDYHSHVRLCRKKNSVCGRDVVSWV